MLPLKLSRRYSHWIFVLKIVIAGLTVVLVLQGIGHLGSWVFSLVNRAHDLTSGSARGSREFVWIPGT